MGRIGRLLSFVRVMLGETNVSDVQVDRGGADNRTPQHFSDIGDDSFPLSGDYVATVNQAGTGRDSVVGYIDPKNQQKATAGDKRVYARDPETGDEAVEVWLKSTGEAEVRNDSGSFVVQSDGSIRGSNFNGNFELQSDGSIQGSNSNGNFELQSDGDAEIRNDSCSFVVRADGSIQGSNSNGNFELQSDGDFVVNGVTIAMDGTITTPTAVNSPSVVANGKELAGHTHPHGFRPGNTDPNN